MAGPVDAGGGAAGAAHKIKGGRWTVFRFFLVSVAFTSAWLAVSSQLDYFSALHGPQVLLQLNIAYYLPSIPLLAMSALLDKPLEARLGVARTILVRLVVGLVGYGAVCSWLPFAPPSIWFLLAAVVALGLFSGIAFSSSYQLVARFANKNVIALGLGCSASGPLVLALQLLLGGGASPSRAQQIALYESIAVLIAGGLWATTSLLVRHWDAIEAHSSGHPPPRRSDAAEPLLGGAEDGGSPPVPASPATPTHSPLAGSPSPDPSPTAAQQWRSQSHPPPGSRRPPSVATTPQRMLLALGAEVWRHRSLPPLAAYNSLEPFGTFLSTDEEVVQSQTYNSWVEEGALGAAAAADGDQAELGAAPRGGGGGGIPRQLSAPGGLLLGAVEESPAKTAPSPAAGGSPSPGGSEAAGAAAGSPAGSPRAPPPPPPPPGSGSTLAAARLIWAPMAALCLSSMIALVIFPTFTYFPSSGRFGAELPKVLFFARIFSDIAGRFLPRLPSLAAERPTTPLVAAGAKLLGVPLCALYLKSPGWAHTDAGAVLFVCALWLLGGYINTMANMLAPRLVPPHLKGAAAGLMALAYQVAHVLGLTAATLLVYCLFGSIRVG